MSAFQISAASASGQVTSRHLRHNLNPNRRQRRRLYPLSFYVVKRQTNKTSPRSAGPKQQANDFSCLAVYGQVQMLMDDRLCVSFCECDYVHVLV